MARHHYDPLSSPGRSRPKSGWRLGIRIGSVLAFVAGMVGLGALNSLLHATSTNEFCYSCHSHERFIKPEYEASSHFSNPRGIRADCADCHLPRDTIALLLKKIAVSADVIPTLMGKLDTAEAYEAARMQMAETVWAEFRANDSEYCRHCHAIEAMDLDAQSAAAHRLHTSAGERNLTCIDCHKGIVHALPQASSAGPPAPTPFPEQ